MNISIAKTANAISINDTAVNVTVAAISKNITISGVGIAGVGVPTGGSTDMILTKASGTNYDTQWVDTIDSINMNGGYF